MRLISLQAMRALRSCVVASFALCVGVDTPASTGAAFAFRLNARDTCGICCWIIALHLLMFLPIAFRIGQYVGDIGCIVPFGLMVGLRIPFMLPQSD